MERYVSIVAYGDAGANLGRPPVRTRTVCRCKPARYVGADLRRTPMRNCVVRRREYAGRD